MHRTCLKILLHMRQMDLCSQRHMDICRRRCSRMRSRRKTTSIRIRITAMRMLVIPVRLKPCHLPFLETTIPAHHHREALSLHEYLLLICRMCQTLLASHPHRIITLRKTAKRRGIIVCNPHTMLNNNNNNNSSSSSSNSNRRSRSCPACKGVCQTCGLVCSRWQVRTPG